MYFLFGILTTSFFCINRKNCFAIFTNNYFSRNKKSQIFSIYTVDLCSKMKIEDWLARLMTPCTMKNYSDHIFYKAEVKRILHRNIALISLEWFSIIVIERYKSYDHMVTKCFNLILFFNIGIFSFLCSSYFYGKIDKTYLLLISIFQTNNCWSLEEI